MPILSIRHVTAYHYKQPVAFGEHRIMLRPRDDEDQKLLESKLEITPEPSQLSWTLRSPRKRSSMHWKTCRWKF
jgi:transglutaminase-like putative cysteine protease